MKCRHCENNIKVKFIDLGFAPPSNAYINKSELNVTEKYFPLRVMVCTNCWLVQTEDYCSAENLFTNEYAYFSSFSKSWLKHSKDFVDMICPIMELTSKSFVVEIASNDGYLLKNFVNKKIPCLGIEPTQNTALIAKKKGIDVIEDFFTSKIAKLVKKNYGLADLIIANNVYAHVPNINDFTKALKILIKPEGVITIEFPHLMELIKGKQFDTIYHEHYSYFSLNTVMRIFKKEKLKIFNVEKLATHGGSLRIYGVHEDNEINVSSNIRKILIEEKEFGMQNIHIYTSFQEKIYNTKNNLLKFLIKAKQNNKRVVGYGAAAKGNTLLNFAGIGPDLLHCIYDASKAKQGKLTPGTHIPILSPSKLVIDKADYILILPWNLTAEIKEYVQRLSKRKVKFICAIPELKEL
jgi:2-polyprenyl-3-methyl-5-hydroxy-6-metoxy-1,4-benzoquinol methylase